MNKLIFLSILLASVAVSEAIKCYNCTGCEDSPDSKYLVTCPSGISVCSSARSTEVASNQVVRDCGKAGDGTGCRLNFSGGEITQYCRCVEDGCNTDSIDYGVSKAIECYKCTGCEAPFDSKDLVTCPSNIGSCYSARSSKVASNQVVRDCGKAGSASECSTVTINGEKSETCYCTGNGCNTVLSTATATKVSITSLFSALLTILVFA